MRPRANVIAAALSLVAFAGVCLAANPEADAAAGDAAKKKRKNDDAAPGERGPAAETTGALTDTAAMARLWKRGRKAYYDGEYEAATTAFGAIVAAGVENTDVHYNLGNAHYKSGRLGRAILEYERALRLDPWHGDARFNLAVADRQVLAAAGEDPAGALGRGEPPVTERLLQTFAADGWAILLAAGWLSLFGALIARRFAERGTVLRSVTFVVILLCIVVTPLAGFGLWSRARFDSHDHRAVVVTERATLRAGPSEDNPPAFDVREGIRVAVTGEDAGWVKIRLAEGLEAWAAPGVVERM